MAPGTRNAAPRTTNTALSRMTAVVKLDWNPSAQRENQISPEAINQDKIQKKYVVAAGILLIAETGRADLARPTLVTLIIGTLAAAGFYMTSPPTRPVGRRLFIDSPIQFRKTLMGADVHSG
jgi:hypothetical protein